MISEPVHGILVVRYFEGEKGGGSHPVLPPLLFPRGNGEGGALHSSDNAGSAEWPATSTSPKLVEAFSVTPSDSLLAPWSLESCMEPRRRGWTRQRRRMGSGGGDGGCVAREGGWGQGIKAAEDGGGGVPRRTGAGVG